jgi:hypothetical protein
LLLSTSSILLQPSAALTVGGKINLSAGDLDLEMDELNAFAPVTVDLGAGDDVER